MSKFGVIDQLVAQTGANPRMTNITVGEVVDTNDPQQMGRVRAICPAMGDVKGQALKHTPWAMYGSPFGGVNELTTRGREDTRSEGPIHYGMWAIPKIGSFVLIMCIDGNPAHRVWLGCLQGQFFPHTMPHGRYFDETNEGPLTSTEQPIEPLHSNMTERFSGDRASFEFKTRGADNQVAYLSPEEVATRVEFSDKADERTQGYTRSRIQPDQVFENTGGVNYDSQIYSWTTPGFHAIHMDDRADSCRMRFRTTHGNQIIFDDTNERIVISTPQGKTWIEVDERGTIDIYGEQDISIRSDQDINLSAGKSIRMKANDGIHMIAGDEVRIHAKAEGNDPRGDKGIHFKSEEDIHIQSVQTLDILTGAQARIQIGSILDIKTSGATNITSGGALGINVTGATAITQTGSFDVNAGGAANITGSTFDVSGGGAITMTAGVIDLNGPPAATAATAATATDAVIAFESFEISRQPAHEPWARVYSSMTAADNNIGNTFTPEFGYGDANVGKTTTRPGRPTNRNARWKR